MINLRLLAISSFLVLICFLGILHIKSLNDQDQALQQSSIETINRIAFSEALGNMLWNTLSNDAPYYDFDIVIKTMTDIEKGKRKPVSTQVDRSEMIKFRYAILEKEAKENQILAEQFLADLANKENIFEIKQGKLYFEIVQEGKGHIISPHASPTLHFSEKDLSQSLIRDTKASNKPLKIKLSETIPGFFLGVSGMRVGEIRRIFVHPELAYGKFAKSGAPNQLIIFEVEIIKD